MAGYWNELVTQKSWEKLVELSKEFNIVVIGGWAVYLWTKQHKSKDIDVIVDFSTMQDLKTKFDIVKNNRLKKCEVKLADFDVDIYLPHYSRIELPVETLLEKYQTKIDGIKTITAEALLVLKQGAARDRLQSIKGKKDAIDIASLLIYAVDLNVYLKILKEEKKEPLLKELETILKHFDNKDCIYLGKNFKEFAQWKKETLKKLKELK